MSRPPTDLRRALLDQARLLLLEHGYPGLTMRRIAAAAGCTPTSIYLHFRDKDDLLHTLIEEGMELLRTRLEAAAAEPEPRARLDALCRTYLLFGLENPSYYEVMFTLRPPSMERFPAEKYRLARRNLEFFAEALAELAADRGREVDPQLLASVTWASLHGAVALMISQRIDRSIDRDSFLHSAASHACSAVDAELPRATAPGATVLTPPPRVAGNER